jgi:hypothetical protein
MDPITAAIVTGLVLDVLYQLRAQGRIVGPREVGRILGHEGNRTYLAWEPARLEEVQPDDGVPYALTALGARRHPLDGTPDGLFVVVAGGARGVSRPHR